MNSRRVIPQEWKEADRDVKDVVCKAVTSFHKASDHKEKTDFLAFLCNELVCNLSLDLEEVFLCHVFPQLVEFVDKVFLEIDEAINSERNDKSNRSEILCDLLIVVLTILDCIKKCITHLNETFSYINIGQINSLPVPVLIIVKSAFYHCQKSEEHYGILFQDLSEQLALMFRKSFEIQKLLLELINGKVETLDGNNSEKDFKNIAEVCDHLLDICEISENIDGNTTPGIWKSLMRLMVKNRDKIRNYLEVDKVVSQLCSTLNRKLNVQQFKKNDHEQETEECLQKAFKVLKFLIKLLMTFVQSFQDYLLAVSYKSILNLLYTTISLTLLPATQPTLLNTREDFKTFLTSSVEPFLKIMVPNTFFANILTEINEDVCQNSSFSRCYILANIVVLLPMISEEILKYWINPSNNVGDEPRVSVLEALLQSCNSCFVEMSLPLMLPGRMCNGKPQRLISFYEYVVSRLSAFLTAIPSQYFHIAENVLLQNVLHGTLICSVMVTDVWCFVARWATAELCYCHVKTFLDWLVTISWKSDLAKFRLQRLVRRLLPLVATEHQELLVKQFPFGCFENLEIWSLVPFHKMVQPIREQISKPLSQQLVALLHQWLVDKQLSSSDLEKCLSCLDNLVSDQSVLKCLSNQEKSDLMLLTQQLLDAFLSCSDQISTTAWASFINILKYVLVQMQPQNFIKVLDNIGKAVRLFQHDFRNVNFAHVMSECGKRTFPITQDDSKFISDIFRVLVTSNNWLVHNEGFLALRRFAEVTPYTPVLEDCVPDELKEAFQKFICTIPYGCDENADTTKMLLNSLREQAAGLAIIENNNHIWESKTTDPDIDKRKREDDDESEPKRKKIESKTAIAPEDEQKLMDSVEEISKHIGIIEEISLHNAVSSYLVDKLKMTAQSLDKLVKSNLF